MSSNITSYYGDIAVGGTIGALVLGILGYGMYSYANPPKIRPRSESLINTGVGNEGDPNDIMISLPREKSKILPRNESLINTGVGNEGDPNDIMVSLPTTGGKRRKTKSKRKRTKKTSKRRH